MASRRSLWILWTACLCALALEVFVSYRLPAPPRAWVAAETAVAGFVLSLFALCAGVGSFAVRETFLLRHLRKGALDPSTPAGRARVRGVLLTLWGLCLLIGVFGGLLAYWAASPRVAWPYQIGAAALLVIHAPRGWLDRDMERSREAD